MNFDKCVQLSNHYHNQVIEYFTQPTRLPGAHLDSTLFPTASPWQPPICFLSLLFYLSHIITIGSYSIYNLSGWFLLLSIILLRFIHEIMYTCSSFLLLRCSSLYECTTIDSISSWWAFGFWVFLFPGMGYYEESCWKHSRTGLRVDISFHFSRGNT